MRKTTKLHTDEYGFASIVVALVMILVLALITVGFAQLSRREQQAALFNQLSSQAYYAAESGVNDVIQAIHSTDPATRISESTPNVDTNQCIGAPLTTGDLNIINAENDVSYTCALVNLKPPDAKWTAVEDRSSQNMTFRTTGDTLDALTVSWGSADSHNTPRPEGDTDFIPKDAWGNSPAVIQFSITPMGTTAAGVDRLDLINKSFTAYLFPDGSATPGIGSATYQSDVVSPQPQPIVSGKCATTGAYPCKVTISGISNHSGATPGETFLIHFVNYYDTSNVLINSLQGKNGTASDFDQGQAVIDVTGKAKNILKRIQVRYPLNDSAPKPTDAIEAGNACKQFDTYPGVTQYDPLNTGASCIF